MESVYSLVNDIKNYPYFINGCSSANILEDLDTHMIASIGIKKAGVSFKFTKKFTRIPIINRDAFGGGAF